MRKIYAENIGWRSKNQIGVPRFPCAPVVLLPKTKSSDLGDLGMFCESCHQFKYKITLP